MAFAAAVADEEGHVLHNGGRGDLHLSLSPGRANAPAIGWLMLVICVYVYIYVWCYRGSQNSSPTVRFCQNGSRGEQAHIFDFHSQINSKLRFGMAIDHQVPSWLMI